MQSGPDSDMKGLHKAKLQLSLVRIVLVLQLNQGALDLNGAIPTLQQMNVHLVHGLGSIGEGFEGCGEESTETASGAAVCAGHAGEANGASSSFADFIGFGKGAAFHLLVEEHGVVGGEFFVLG